MSFLIDTREVLATDWKQFDRVVIEGRVELITDDSAEYRPLLAEIATKDAMTATFIERGNLYRICPAGSCCARASGASHASWNTPSGLGAGVRRGGRRIFRRR